MDAKHMAMVYTYAIFWICCMMYPMLHGNLNPSLMGCVPFFFLSLGTWGLVAGGSRDLEWDLFTILTFKP